ncbi:ATPase, V0 complex, subunit D [Nadsonia fulvescens var. elongata DSM 6958]|uniref:V-type proton ATPase subunit n=1 Tax=Nadsonia fulvescens var. elongata DSM 6958 TaxID=857566 RepID=A0A1E3PKX7_9ASCO|nr:ATPase, V0 complex, subunit D [Nadsonia fulvescens var. elongata DSM 6958]
MEGLFFNIDSGFIEAVVRGYRSGLLGSAQYVNLTQCDSLEDLKLQLSATDYGSFLSSFPTLSTSLIQQNAAKKLIAEFRFIRAQAVDPLAKFMDYITYGYMIDNVALLITGTIHERDRSEILERCNPLGWFDTLPALSAATDVESLYDTVLVDTPLAPYFKNCFTHAGDLDDLNIEVIRNRLYKAYLEDFYKFTQTLSNPSNEIMGRLLEFEADRRSINIALNSFDTELSREDKLSLMPEFGKLYPTGTYHLSRADDAESVKYAVEIIGEYQGFFDTGNNKNLEDHFYQMEMELCKAAFTQQFTYSTIWAWLRSKEQEVRNITWIAECIAQNQKERINNYISVF